MISTLGVLELILIALVGMVLVVGIVSAALVIFWIARSRASTGDPMLSHRDAKRLRPLSSATDSTSEGSGD
ncbi:MAG: hypothetical protein BWY17_03270 [Deltaproteobacteria bacterium ADurb.Bin207]|nr:MAG: hypothetical protein BWY17_03270 [Deltaproteobacteria bacterium ADurb.Bin207]HQB42228.1 hypothetical protein [Polyangiaceae bacterium]